MRLELIVGRTNRHQSSIQISSHHSHPIYTASSALSSILLLITHNTFHLFIFSCIYHHIAHLLVLKCISVVDRDRIKPNNMSADPLSSSSSTLESDDTVSSMPFTIDSDPFHFNTRGHSASIGESSSHTHLHTYSFLRFFILHHSSSSSNAFSFPISFITIICSRSHTHTSLTRT